MDLPIGIRDALVEELDEFIESVGKNVTAEAVVERLMEILEVAADEHGLDDLVLELEESGALDSPLAEFLEEEMDSNDEFEFTGEEVAVLLERSCEIEWDESEQDAEEEEEDDDY